jgi:hypothetical protein
MEPRTSRLRTGPGLTVPSQRPAARGTPAETMKRAAVLIKTAEPV